MLFPSSGLGWQGELALTAVAVFFQIVGHCNAVQ